MKCLHGADEGTSCLDTVPALVVGAAYVSVGSAWSAGGSVGTGRHTAPSDGPYKLGGSLGDGQVQTWGLSSPAEGVQPGPIFPVLPELRGPMQHPTDQSGSSTGERPRACWWFPGTLGLVFSVRHGSGLHTARRADLSSRDVAPSMRSQRIWVSRSAPRGVKRLCVR